MAKLMQAQDTFVGTMPDGADHFVAKGSPYPEGHPVVKQWPGLFGVMDMGEDEPPAKSEPAKAPAKAPAADVKPAAKAPAAPKAAGRG